MIDGKLTTAEAARRVGIHPVTLQRWIAARKVRYPKPTLIGAVGYRLWSAEDVENLRTAKQTIYGKGKGRRKKSKA